MVGEVYEIKEKDRFILDLQISKKDTVVNEKHFQFKCEIAEFNMTLHKVIIKNLS